MKEVEPSTIVIHELEIQKLKKTAGYSSTTLDTRYRSRQEKVQGSRWSYHKVTGQSYDYPWEHGQRGGGCGVRLRAGYRQKVQAILSLLVCRLLISGDNHKSATTFLRENRAITLKATMPTRIPAAKKTKAMMSQMTPQTVGSSVSETMC